EAVAIEIPIPNANTAAEWNEAMRSGAQKANVEVPGLTEKPATAATDTTKKDEPTADKLFRASLMVNGSEMIFEDADPAKVLAQYTAAVSASQLAPQAAATTQQTVEEKKPALSAADMFDVGTKLISGDASGLDTLLEKSGALDRWFESKGLNVEKLKAATEKTQSDTVHDSWKTATDQFTAKVTAGEIDFPGGQQNMKMMGITLAQLGLKPSVDSMVKAWEHMKKEGLVFPVEKTTGGGAGATQASTETKKTATSSTAIGVSGGKDTTQNQNVPLAQRRFELDLTKLSQAEAAQAWNNLIDQGVKPEQITVIQ
ncbi:MAG TPA: hypothetical protein VHW72_01350, partial [Candidatus Angelobacter sp.]|nr:hypothetical protein [Candidatus Angelobacter sp.]